MSKARVYALKPSITPKTPYTLKTDQFTSGRFIYSMRKIEKFRNISSSSSA
jgi:hypothetical protein